MILRICVVIPTFNNARTISEVIKDVLLTTALPILVVDDGSETPVENVLYSWDVRGALEAGRVRVVRFEKNQGKGAALKFAIGDLVSRGFTHMFTMDADGQHHGYEITKLTELAQKHPWDLIIGNRRFKSENVPEISKFGRKFSNFWVNYQTGLQIKDSQSGFRLYPLLPLQTMKFYTAHYDFEIEVLIRMLWNGIQVRETEIDVFYPEGKDRVSHFNKLWDNVRISTLNTLLVVVSLFKTHRSPREFAAAMGLGVFIGCTPLFGFHTLIVAALAFALRLNVVIMWVGTHVSTPLLAPLVIWAEIWIGRNWLHIGGSGAKHDFYQWLAGSLVLGIGGGVAVALITYGLAWFYQTRKPRSNWTGRTRGGRLGNGFLKNVLKYGGIEAGYMCLMFIIPYFYLFAPKARRGLNEYWKLVEPGDTWRARQVRICRHFYRFGQVLMDRVYQGFHREKKFATTHSGSEAINITLAEGKGLMLLSSHMGAWDLAAALLPANGFSDQIHLVEFRSDGFSFQNVKDKMNPAHVRSLDSAKRGDAIFEIHQALKRGRCIGLMGDRPMADRFELIPFMGRIAPFDVTAFRMAAALRVPLIFTYGFKGAANLYDFYARPARVYCYNAEEPREQQLYRWACEYAADIESFIRKYPDQWFNFYPFWSAIPMSPDGTVGARDHNVTIEDLLRRPRNSASAPARPEISDPRK
jgi:predicted LPLAT superfamily acyltransferase/glycosyltransferase involved in cell wall biosynthesis